MLPKVVARRLRRRRIPWRRIREVLRASLPEFLRADSFTISASIAYYSLLCVFPLLLLLTAVAGLYIRHHELSARLAILLERFLPFTPDVILDNLAAVTHDYGRVGFASFLLLLWGSSGVFLPLEKALNRAWAVEQERSWWRSRLLALEMALIATLVVAISLGLVGVSLYIRRQFDSMAPALPVLLIEYSSRALIAAGTFVLTLLMFLIVMARLPNRHMRWREVLPSALLTSLLWELARTVFTFFLPHFNYRHVYGSIGALVAFMTWMYISAAVTLFGAQVSSALYRAFDRE
ncbi:MAG TPA: YihY/virulence factor BrkB family protein [Terriglobia bacterium]|nr:YihY/virulence factor BrkB family protein [Terriglobia bacterium]